VARDEGKNVEAVEVARRFLASDIPVAAILDIYTPPVLEA